MQIPPPKPKKHERKSEKRKKKVGQKKNKLEKQEVKTSGPVAKKYKLK